MLRVILAIFVVSLLALPVVGWWLTQSSLPKSDGINIVPGLSKEAAVVTDDRGVPYITASSEPDLYRAQGYWIASQRLFQMDMLRRIARGELSEVFGSHCLPQDKLMRQIGFSRMAREEVKLLSKEAKQALQVYCDGVNASMREQEGRRPLEFLLLGYWPGPWQPEDTLALMKYQQYLQEESWSLDDLRQRVLDKAGPDITSTLFEDGFRAPAPQTVNTSAPASLTGGTTSSSGAATAPASTGESVDSGQLSSPGSAPAASHSAAGTPESRSENSASSSVQRGGGAGPKEQRGAAGVKRTAPAHGTRSGAAPAPGPAAARVKRARLREQGAGRRQGGERNLDPAARYGPADRDGNSDRYSAPNDYSRPEPDNEPDSRQLPPMVRHIIESLPGVGSNAWAVAGGGTDTGGCLLALDRHSDFTEPNLWYACTLSTASFKVSGITIPGVPGIIFGRNNRITWGATAYKADTQDLFIEQFSPQFPSKYKTPDGWGGAREIIEEIACKSTFQKQIYQHKVVVTRHGPILLENGSNGVALAWSGNDIALPQFESLYRLNRAANWNQFRNILKNYRGASQTFVYADKDGNIGMQIAGNIPVRKESELTGKFKASQVLLGWTGTYDWISRLDFQEMPYVYNPKEGFLVANSPLFNLKGFQPPVSPYPVQRAQFVLASYRAANRKPGLPDMADLQADEYAPLHVLVKSTLQKCINKQEVIDQYQLSALKFMDRWDGFLRRQSASAAIYEAFVRAVARRSLANKLGVPLTQEYLRRWPRWSVQVERILSQKDPEWLPVEERKFDTFVVTSFSQGLKELRGKMNQDLASLSWEKFHKAAFKHIIFEGQPDWEPTLGRILDVGPVGVGGDSDTINSFQTDMAGKADEFTATVGPTERMLVDMSDGDKFYETQPLGQSGHFMAPDRLDQLKAWIQASPLPVAYSDQQSEKLQRHKVIFTADGNP